MLQMLKNYGRIIKYPFNNNAAILENTDAFFSPNYAIPEEIIKHPRIKKFLMLHDTIPFLFPGYNTESKIISRIIETLDRETFCFCNSECTKNDFLKYSGTVIDEQKLIVTYIAQAQNFKPLYNTEKLISVLNKYGVSHKHDGKYIFSFCTLEPRKNLVFTIKCFLKFIKKHSIDDLCFYLGGGQCSSFVLELEKSVGNFAEYKNKIVHMGYICDDDVNVLYSNSLFFTYISQYEGFGMPPLEAMSAGTPVITSNNSSIPEVVGNAAITIDYDSEEQCIKTFEDFYFNEDLRMQYIAKGIERAKLFSWEKTVNHITETISKAVWKN
jgi:glycosyltransferase involved in cell wall biosynthesis